MASPSSRILVSLKHIFLIWMSIITSFVDGGIATSIVETINLKFANQLLD